MNTYVFQLGAGQTPMAGALRFTATSDLDASVRAFDLLRSHPDCDWIVVSVDGQAVLRRTRAGQKQVLVWLRPRPDMGVRRAAQHGSLDRRDRGS